jgi:hypothetical protein
VDRTGRLAETIRNFSRREAGNMPKEHDAALCHGQRVERVAQRLS